MICRPSEALKWRLLASWTAHGTGRVVDWATIEEKLRVVCPTLLLEVARLSLIHKILQQKMKMRIKECSFVLGTRDLSSKKLDTSSHTHTTNRMVQKIACFRMRGCKWMMVQGEKARDDRMTLTRSESEVVEERMSVERQRSGVARTARNVGGWMVATAI